MKRKLAFIHELYPHGGAERVSADIAAHMHDRGWEIYMFVSVLHPDKLTERDHATLNLIELPDRSDMNSEQNAEFIIKKLNDLLIDIFVIPIAPLKHMGRIREATKSKIVFSHHNMPFWETIHEEEYFKLRIRRNKPLKRLKRRLLYLPYYKLTGRFKKRPLKFYRQAYEQSDMFTTLRPEYCSQLCERLDIDPNNNHLEWVNNFVYPHTYDDLTKKKQVLSLGRITYIDKRVDRIIDIWDEIWREFPDWELLIVGDGPDKDDLVEMVRNRSIGNVTFKPFTKTPEEYYAHASILGFTSAHEGWGMVITEAMQAGVVPIAYDCSAGVRTQLEPDGVNGVIIPPVDREAYVRRLRELMSDDALRDQMSLNVREKVKLYSPEASCSKWEQLFNKLLEDSPRKD